jgi:hypothetical protein
MEGTHVHSMGAETQYGQKGGFGIALTVLRKHGVCVCVCVADMLTCHSVHTLTFNAIPYVDMDQNPMCWNVTAFYVLICNVNIY